MKRPLQLWAARWHRPKAAFRGRWSSVGRVGTCRTLLCCLECPVRLHCAAESPSPSASPFIPIASKLGTASYRRRLKRHFLAVCNGSRCGGASRTRETHHSSYQTTPRTRIARPCALPCSDALACLCLPRAVPWSRGDRRIEEPGEPRTRRRLLRLGGLAQPKESLEYDYIHE